MKKFDTKILFSKLSFERTFLAIPFFFIFLANILITQVRGLEFAGKLAIFAGLSSFFSFFFCLRWDAEILVKPLDNLRNSLQSGMLMVFTIFLVCISLFFLLNLRFSNDIYYLLLIGSASLIGLYEILLNALLKIKNIKIYVLFRLIPPALLFYFCFNNFTESISWILSLLFPTICLFFFSLFKFSLNNTWLSALLSYISSSKDKIIPTISTVISNSIPLLWLLIIAHLFGESEAGFWINAYRIFSLPVAFCGAAILPYVLAIIGDKDKAYRKFSLMFKFQLLLLVISFISLVYSYFLGQLSFSFLIKQEVSIDKVIIYCVIAISFMQYSLQYWKEIYQSINRTLVFFSILVIELILAVLIYFLLEIDTIKSLVFIILVVTVIPYFLASILTIYLNRDYRSEMQ